MAAARREPWKSNCGRSGEGCYQAAGVTSIDVGLSAAACLIVQPNYTRGVRSVKVSVAAVRVLIGLEAIQSAGRRIQRPVVVRVLHHVPLAISVPVLVDERLFLARGGSRLQNRVDFRVRLVLY